MLFECFTFTFLFNLIKQGKLSKQKPCYFSNKKYGSSNALAFQTIAAIGHDREIVSQ